MTDFKKVTLALATAGLLSSGAVQAALNDRGGGLIYDDVLNITWLANANYGHGEMSFSAANTWASGLSYGGYDDWRLPTALNQDGTGPCEGYNCTSSEMGHMFYNSMGAGSWASGNHYGILGGTNTTNLALFTHLHLPVYWSGTVSALYPTLSAWFFGNRQGFQNTATQDTEFNAWAVRDGDVAAIPEPETYAMLLAGLGLLGGVAKWRRRSFGAS